MHGLVENVGNILQNTIQFFLTIAITKKKSIPGFQSQKQYKQKGT